MTTQALKALETTAINKRCTKCGEPIGIGVSYYSLDGKVYCAKCVVAGVTGTINFGAREAYTGGSGDGVSPELVERLRYRVDNYTAHYSQSDRDLDKLLLAAIRSLALPAMEGWKLVPMEPTEEMTEVGFRFTHPAHVYRSMLAASPPSPDNERDSTEKPQPCPMCGQGCYGFCPACGYHIGSGHK